KYGRRLTPAASAAAKGRPATAQKAAAGNAEDARLLWRRGRAGVGRIDVELVDHVLHAARPACDALRLELVLGRRDLPVKSHDTAVGLDTDIEEGLQFVGGELRLDRRRDLRVIELLADGLVRGDRRADDGSRRDECYEHTQDSLHWRGPPARG